MSAVVVGDMSHSIKKTGCIFTFLFYKKNTLKMQKESTVSHIFSSLSIDWYQTKIYLKVYILPTVQIGNRKIGRKFV